MVKSVVLFSGGIDSTTALYWALAKGPSVHALSFDYGQRHRVEIRMARKLVRKIGIPQTIFKLDLKQVGGSALTDSSIEVPRYNNLSQIKHGPPATYQPFRNGVLLALTAAWANPEASRKSSAASISSTPPITRTRGRRLSRPWKRPSTPEPGLLSAGRR